MELETSSRNRTWAGRNGNQTIKIEVMCGTDYGVWSNIPSSQQQSQSMRENL